MHLLRQLLSPRYRTVRFATAVLVPAFSLAAMFMSSSSALADPEYSTFHTCQVNGQTLCLNASSLSDGSDITASGSNARTLVASYTGGSYCHAGVCYDVYNLKFSADTSKCVAADSQYNLVVEGCSASYTSWANYEYPANTGNDKWINKKASDDTGSIQLMSSNNSAGSIMRIEGDGANGWYQWWYEYPSF